MKTPLRLAGAVLVVLLAAWGAYDLASMLQLHLAARKPGKPA